MTHEQAEILEHIKSRHGRLRRIPDDSTLGDSVLGRCVTDTYAFQCCACRLVFTVEPDGVTEAWMVVE